MEFSKILSQSGFEPNPGMTYHELSGRAFRSYVRPACVVRTYELTYFTYDARWKHEELCCFLTGLSKRVRVYVAFCLQCVSFGGFVCPRVRTKGTGQ
jgi:hypothetical protein